MNKWKLSALLSLALVFFSGAVLGAFAYRLYSASPVQSRFSPPGQRKGGPDDFRKDYIARLTKDVKLDAEQVKQLNAILDKTHEEMNQLNEKTKPERDALNAQRNTFEEKWRPEREAIHTRQVEQINAMLRTDQREAYAAFQAERDRLRRMQHDQRKKQ